MGIRHPSSMIGSLIVALASTAAFAQDKAASSDAAPATPAAAADKAEAAAAKAKATAGDAKKAAEDAKKDAKAAANEAEKAAENAADAAKASAAAPPAAPTATATPTPAVAAPAAAAAQSQADAAAANAEAAEQNAEAAEQNAAAAEQTAEAAQENAEAAQENAENAQAAALAAAPPMVVTDDDELGVPAPSFYVGISGGLHAVLTDWDFQEIDDEGRFVSPETGPLGKLRLGFQLTERLALEAAVGHFAFDASAETNPGMIYEGDLLIYLANEDPWSGFVALGGGAYHNLEPDTDDTELDAQFHLGLGTKIGLAEWVWLRGEVRYYITDTLDPDIPIANNLEASVGFDFMLAGPDRGPVDTDKDGIVDELDRCPTVPGHDTAQGCPDRDRDGIVDSEDKCPDAAGPAELQGCPDRDGDGLIDPEDECPDQAGPIERKGCPPGDRDKDGILDEQDACPDKPEDMDGIQDTDGCPEEDADGDGILDPVDKCPLKKEIINNFADTDGCPDELETPTVVVTCERFELNDRIYFDLNKYTIQARSFPLLDKVAEALNKHDFVKKVRIEGHTDNQGSDSYNLKLSQNRAKSVLDYLAKKGVSRDRLVSQGFGEERPVASNETDTGRAQNRRVDFIITEQAEREDCKPAEVKVMPKTATPAQP